MLTIVIVPENKELNEANFDLRYNPFTNTCHIETYVNFLTFTFGLDSLVCSVHSWKLIL